MLAWWEVSDCWGAAWDGMFWALSETTALWGTAMHVSMVGRWWCGMSAFLESKMMVLDGRRVVVDAGGGKSLDGWRCGTAAYLASKVVLCDTGVRRGIGMECRVG